MSEESFVHGREPASARVFAIAELVRAISEHVASQDLAAFRLTNRSASIYGAAQQFAWIAYTWPKGNAFKRVGKGKEVLRYTRHIIVDTDVDSWEAYGDDFRPSDKRKEQWSRLYSLLEAPELSHLETIDLKGSIRWAAQMEGLSQPEFKLDNRMSRSLRSLCLTGITQSADRHWDIAMARSWWPSISNLIERCIDTQSSLGEIKFRHFHIGAEGDASILCGPPTAGFITTFRTRLLGLLESLTLGRLSYETSRALLGPLDLPATAEISQYRQYDWPVWTHLKQLRISFGRGADIATSRLCDHVLDHCPALEELYLTLGESQPLRLENGLATLRHFVIEVPELVLGAHIRGEVERERLQAFILQQTDLISLSVDFTEIRDRGLGRYTAKVCSGAPPVEVSARTHPLLCGCTGNFVKFGPATDASILRWELGATHPHARSGSSQDLRASLSKDWLAQLSALDTTKLSCLSLRESPAVTVAEKSANTASRQGSEAPKTSFLDYAEVLRMLADADRGLLPALVEVELKGQLRPDKSTTTQLLLQVEQAITAISHIPTVRALLFSPFQTSELEAHIEHLRLPARSLGPRLELLGVGTELFDRIDAGSDNVAFRRRIGRHHPLRSRTLIHPPPRLPLWWGEQYKLRDQPDLVSFPDPFYSILDHLHVDPTRRDDAAEKGSRPSPRMPPQVRTVATRPALP